MKTVAMGLAALLMSTSVYAQSAATGGERGGRSMERGQGMERDGVRNAGMRGEGGAREGVRNTSEQGGSMGGRTSGERGGAQRGGMEGGARGGSEGGSGMSGR